jgi:HK97 family phage prohead protease
MELKNSKGSLICKSIYSPVETIDLENRTIDVLITSNAVDRDREIVERGALDERLSIYQQHPIVLADHKAGDLDYIIGETTKLYDTAEGKRAVIKYMKNHKRADFAWYIASEMKLAAFSIAFFPLEWVEGNGKDFYVKYTKAELLEISQVLLPSFRDAIQDDRKLSSNVGFVKACKSYYGEKEVEEVLNEIEKKEENVALQWLEGNYLELEKLIKGKEEVPQPESPLKRLSKKFSNLKGG